MGPRTSRRRRALNYDKLDAALAAAVEGGPDPDSPDLVVFVESEPGGIRTATLSARGVAALSEQPDVRRLRLAQRLGPAEGGEVRPTGG